MARPDMNYSDTQTTGPLGQVPIDPLGDSAFQAELTRREEKRRERQEKILAKQKAAQEAREAAIREEQERARRRAGQKALAGKVRATRPAGPRLGRIAAWLLVGLLLSCICISAFVVLTWRG